MTNNSEQPGESASVQDDTSPDSEDQKLCPDVDSCPGDPSKCELDPSECGASRLQQGGRTSSLADDCLGRSLDQLSRAFTASARRWELIVYPSLFAFVLLAAYGFFLIYSLTQDIGRVADTMDSINRDMNSVAVNMNSVSKNMVIMTQTVDNQSATMREMALNMRGMNVSMAQMRYDISIMNHSVSRPMSFMNSFMPW